MGRDRDSNLCVADAQSRYMSEHCPWGYRLRQNDLLLLPDLTKHSCFSIPFCYAMPLFIIKSIDKKLNQVPPYIFSRWISCRQCRKLMGKILLCHIQVWEATSDKWLAIFTDGSKFHFISLSCLLFAYLFWLVNLCIRGDMRFSKFDSFKQSLSRLISY